MFRYIWETVEDRHTWTTNRMS